MRIQALVLIGLHAVLGVAAVAAGFAFVSETDGSALGMTTEALDGSPFFNYLIPGLFLAVVIGGTNLLSSLALLLRHPMAVRLSFASGLLLVAWVSVQTAIIGFLHWSQIVWWVVFPIVAMLGGWLWREERGE